MINLIKKAIASLSRKPAPRPIIMRRSRKHIRVTHWTFHSTIGYYGENGRKLTTRRVKTSDVARLKDNARKLGYWAS
jgi:hypothetical protein